MTAPSPPVVPAERELPARAHEAAFFRVELALTDVTPLAMPLSLAMNAASIRRRLAGVAETLLGRSIAFGGRIGAVESLEQTYRALAGMTRDRLEVLGEDFAKDELSTRIRPEAARLLDRARARGRRVVLVSEGPLEILRPFARDLEADVLANELEYEDERATGRLVPPVWTSTIDAARLRRYAADHHIDLGRSAAYAHDHRDVVLLSAVREPCCIDPDRDLTRMAADLDWPVVRRAREGASS